MARVDLAWPRGRVAALGWVAGLLWCCASGVPYAHAQTAPGPGTDSASTRGPGVGGAADARAPNRLAPASDLPTQIAAAHRRGQPLVVLISLDGCPYCELVRRSYLLPLSREQGLQVVQVDVRGAQPVQHPADGTRMTHDELAHRWQARMTPTLLFLGPAGVELAPRLVGVPSQDFYGAHLDERLAQARQRLSSMPVR
jgi:hypothetical protein